MPKPRETPKRDSGDIECAICKDSHPFEMPAEIIEALREGRLVIFAGAGISTEGKLVFPFTLYDDVKAELNLAEDDRPPFSDLMEIYSNQKDGRRKLIKKLKRRFDYVESFPEVYRAATRFHTELSFIPHIEEIITTNWDDYFETECGAIPIVTPDDFVFWDMPGRKVLKIHGSINSYGSVVITKSDYLSHYRRLNKSIIGAYLRTLLATKLVLFVGYSFGDSEFNKVYRFLAKEMRGLRPHAYAVTLDEKPYSEYEKLGLTKIFTDGLYFIEILKKHLVEEGYMLDEGIFKGILKELNKVRREHFKLWRSLNIVDNPEMLFASCYQEGLIHAFERILARSNTGEYSNQAQIGRWFIAYEEAKREKLKQKKYHDVAYIEGYLNGTFYLIAPQDKRNTLPYYFLFGYDGYIRDIDEYIKRSKRAAILHKTAYAYAKRIIKRRGVPHEGITFHHTAFL